MSEFCHSFFIIVIKELDLIHWREYNLLLVLESEVRVVVCGCKQLLNLYLHS